MYLLVSLCIRRARTIISQPVVHTLDGKYRDFRFSMFQFSLSPIARKTIYSYAFSIFRLLRNIIAFQIALHIERHTKYHITHSLAMPFILFFRCASVSSVYLLFFPLFLLLVGVVFQFSRKTFSILFMDLVRVFRASSTDYGATHFAKRAHCTA